MASFTLKDTRFPDGTTVGAYVATPFTAFPANGRPPGTAVKTATATAREVAFTGLGDGTRYFAAAEIGGEWVHYTFTTAPASEPEAWEGAVEEEGDARTAEDSALSGRIATLESAVAVRKNAPLRPEDFGADPSGTVASDKAWEELFTKVPAQGADIYAPAQYKFEKQFPSMDARRAIKIRGAASLTAGTSAASQFLFTQGGAVDLISARSGVGIVFEDIRIWPTNAGFTGRLVNFDSDGLHGQNSDCRLTRVYFQGPGNGVQAGTGLYIPNTADLLAEGCKWGGLDYGIKGEQVEADNSIGINIVGGIMLNCNTAGIQNCGESWGVKGLTVEALASGKAGFIVVESGITPRNLELDTIWMGDANAEGIWIVWRGLAVKISNCTFGGGALGLSLPENDSTKTNYVEASSNRFIGTDAIRANWGGGGGNFRYRFNPNNYSAVSGKKLSLDNGATDLGAGPITN